MILLRTIVVNPVVDLSKFIIILQLIKQKLIILIFMDMNTKSANISAYSIPTKPEYNLV